MSVEMIITIIERIPKSINFTQNILEGLFQIILYHMTSIKDSIDHEWEYPEDEYKEESILYYIILKNNKLKKII